MSIAFTFIVRKMSWIMLADEIKIYTISSIELRKFRIKDYINHATEDLTVCSKWESIFMKYHFLLLKKYSYFVLSKIIQQSGLVWKTRYWQESLWLISFLFPSTIGVDLLKKQVVTQCRMEHMKPGFVAEADISHSRQNISPGTRVK